MKKMNKKGFTLVEIMIVVAIIGLLAAIGIPSFQKARSSSIEKSKDNNIRIAEAAVDQWAMETAQTNAATIDWDAAAEYIKGCDTEDEALLALKVGEAGITLPTVVGGSASY